MGLPPIVSTPAAGGGPVSCCFGPGFKVVGGTDVLIAEPPGPSGWQAGLNPDAVLLPPTAAKCAGKINVPVTMRGDPDDATFEAAVRAGEMEHVAALEALHTKHLVPYYRFISSATAQAATEADCRTALTSQVTGRDDQAATGFILGDLAETRRFDDPVSGTHHSNSIPNVPTGCPSISLLTSISSPQRPGLGPGNVAVVRCNGHPRRSCQAGRLRQRFGGGDHGRAHARLGGGGEQGTRRVPGPQDHRDPLHRQFLVSALQRGATEGCCSVARPSAPSTRPCTRSPLVPPLRPTGRSSKHSRARSL